MKKTVFFALVAAFMLSGVSLFAQNEKQERALKSDIRTIRQESRKDRAKFGTLLKEKKKELRKLQSQDVDYFTKQQFEEDFGNVSNVKWQRFNYYDQATFTQNGVTVNAFYDNQPELIGTIVSKQFSDLPVRAQKQINKKYADYLKGAVVLFDDNEYNDEDIYIWDEPFSGPDTYFIELTKDNKGVVLGISETGDEVFYKELK